MRYLRQLLRSTRQMLRAFLRAKSRKKTLKAAVPHTYRKVGAGKKVFAVVGTLTLAVMASILYFTPTTTTAWISHSLTNILWMLMWVGIFGLGAVILGGLGYLLVRLFGGKKPGAKPAGTKTIGPWRLFLRTVTFAFIFWELIAFPLLAFGIVPRPWGWFAWIPNWGTPNFATVGAWAWANYPVLLGFIGAATMIRLFSRWTDTVADGKALIWTTYVLAAFLFIFCPLAASVQSWWATRQDSEQAYAKDPQPFSPDVTNTYTLTEDVSPYFRADRPTGENEYWFCSTYAGTIAPTWIQKGMNLYRAYSPKGSIEIKYRMLPEKNYPAGCPNQLPS